MQRSTSVSPCGGSADHREDFDAFGFDVRYYDRGMHLAEWYFKWLRVQVDGLDNIPTTGPALLVGNHAGHRCHDALALQYAVRHLHPAKRVIRPLMDRNVGKAPIWGMIATEYAGSVVGHPRNADYLLQHDFLTLVYPEGTYSVIKHFRDRHRLCPPSQWGAGFVRTALRNDVSIVPIVTHGFEAALPTLWLSRRLGRFWGTRRGLFPVSPQAIVTGTVPIFTVAIPFPVRCQISIMEPVYLGDLNTVASRDGDVDVPAVALAVRDMIQRRLSEIALERRRRRHWVQQIGARCAS